jgi:pimeloyl-ACP methyl ester carboxylesterase
MAQTRGGLRRSARVATALAAGFAIALAGATARAEIATHAEVRGRAITQVSLDGHMLPWEQLAESTIAPGTHAIRVSVYAAEGESALEVPVCAGRARIAIDGADVPVASPAPRVVPLTSGANHDVTIMVTVSGYEHRIACGAPLRVGVAAETKEGLGLFTFASPHARAGGGRAVLFVPPGHDVRSPGALLVGAHPWNGGMWTYAAYAALLREAAARDVVLLMPSGLGNSLYTADAEDEVMRAIDALAAEIAVDPRRLSIWGASMGGAGATTIGLHHPDRFASITSFFGDAKYDLSTYVKALLPSEAAAHRVNALDVVDNARHVPVWLVHGEEDRVSPIAQSEILARALEARGFAVRFDRVPHAGHEGALVTRFASEIVARASEARATLRPTRVTFRSVRASDVAAYGVRIERAGSDDAFVDVERRADGVHVLRAIGVRSILFARDALGGAGAADAPVSIVVEPPANGVRAGWETR